MDKVIISAKSNIPEEKLYTEKVIKDLQAENDNLKDDIDKQQLYVDSLEQENERLKKQYNCYACDSCSGKEDYINMKRHTENAIKTVHKYRQALQEIRELIKKLDVSLGCAYGDYDCDNCSDINEETVCKIKLQNIILAKINEVIGAEE